MAALIEVGELHENLDGDDGRFQQQVHSSEEAEALGRSYVCSMSSAIDLECPVDSDHADFTLNVQHYLSRIVDELHLISAWSSSVYQRQQAQTAVDPVSIETGKRSDDSSFAAMARLAVVTDIELMRRDVTKAQLELFQRCTSQMAYVESEASAARSKQDTRYNELKQRMDDKERVLEQHTQSIQALEKARAESDAQTRSLVSALRQVQQQSATHPTRLSALEKALATATTAQFTLEQEAQTLQRRVESFETAHQLQVESTRRAADDSLTGLRSANSQLSAKMKVLRLEMQELGDSTQKRMQQLLKTLSSVAANAPGKPMAMPATAAAPRRPSVVSPRTPRSGGNSHLSQPVTSSESLDGGGSAQTGTDAVVATDCFIYAKAALPHRHAISETNTTTKKTVAPSTGSSRAVTRPPGANVASDTRSIANLLTVQPSVMSVPLGYEDAARPATSTEPRKGSTNVTDRHDPLISMKRGTHRHNSLPDVNLSATQGPLSPKPQASRLHTKL
ncbi:hypothetical protein PHYPSEUDO_007925 [Phytophthora pseudosyringae]|uniref:Uncharacterized protein n=1 Tax=Phytophthora pseudosyringae TaxID=221518 RepID=A0A8T1W8U7_9STRA|nr:hypothetical protein PHYPSEUDO_007925 [Phytophthora pseudosyringae]